MQSENIGGYLVVISLLEQTFFNRLARYLSYFHSSISPMFHNIKQDLSLQLLPKRCISFTRTLAKTWVQCVDGHVETLTIIKKSELTHRKSNGNVDFFNYIHNSVELCWYKKEQVTNQPAHIIHLEGKKRRVINECQGEE
jgi:hypothetical protein